MNVSRQSAWLVQFSPARLCRQARWASKNCRQGPRRTGVYRLRNLPQERDHIVEVICYDLRPARRAAAGLGDRSPRSRSPRSDLEASWAARATEVWARLGSVATSGFGCSDAREQSALAPAIPRSSLMPRTSCGAPMAFGCSRWTTAGAGSSPPSSIGKCVGCMPSAATASPPCSRSPWGLPGCMARNHGSQYLSDHLIKFWGIQPSYAFEPQTNGVAERFNRTLKEQIIHGRIYRAAGRRPRLRRTLQCPVDRRKERLPEPRSSSSGVARRDLNRETNLCPRNRVRYTS